MKDIAIFGSTGSIGRNTLDVVRRFPDKFKVSALTVNSDTDTLISQVREFHPRYICVGDSGAALLMKNIFGRKIKVYFGQGGLIELAKERKIGQCVFAISGAAALFPLISAIESGKDIALANKEALVMAGPIIMRMADKARVRIIPVDSEQSAIWQCIHGQDKKTLKTIYLTASGGPLLKEKQASLGKISVSRVLKHPRWKMGRKITVDSATLMNKGLEFLEAMFLFGVSHKVIKVLIHPEALIHSMVEFKDGVILAQLSKTDMRIPIQYAISYPERLDSVLPGMNFIKLRYLSFQKPDISKFPCLKLAYQAAKELGTLPSVMNAANEIAVNSFLQSGIRFTSIPDIVGKVMRKHKNRIKPSLEDIRQADSWARDKARSYLKEERNN